MSVFHSRESILFRSVTQLCPTLWDSIDCSMPGLPVHHQLPEFTQTHVHWVSDAIQSPDPVSCLSTPACNHSQHQFSSVQSLSPVRHFATPRTTAHQATLSITNFQSPLKPMSIESVMPSNHLILCSPLLLLPSIFPSIRVISNESALCIRWPKYWSFSHQSFQWIFRIYFLRIDWLDLLAVQGTLFSNTIVQNQKFFSTQLSSQSNSHIHTWLLEKP